MKYGYFDNDNREYVITRPDVPAPWTNYLGTEKFCTVISKTLAVTLSISLQSTIVSLNSALMRHLIALDTMSIYVMMKQVITGQSLGSQLQKV